MVVSIKMSVFWVAVPEVSEVCAASIIRALVSTSETSVNFCQTTWHHNPEGSSLQTFTRLNALPSAVHSKQDP
jgi:ureidoglycolate hydrolase